MLVIYSIVNGGTIDDTLPEVAPIRVTLPRSPVILGTIYMVHGSKEWLFTNDGGGWEFPAFWAVALVVQSLIGSGAYSVGHALGIVWR